MNTCTLSRRGAWTTNILERHPQTHPKPPNGNDFDRKGEDGCRGVVFPLFQAEYFDYFLRITNQSLFLVIFQRFRHQTLLVLQRIHKIAVQYTCSASGDGPAADALGFVLDFLKAIKSFQKESFRSSGWRKGSIAPGATTSCSVSFLIIDFHLQTTFFQFVFLHHHENHAFREENINSLLLNDVFVLKLLFVMKKRKCFVLSYCTKLQTVHSRGSSCGAHS